MAKGETIMPADDKNKVTILTLNKNKKTAKNSVFCTAYDCWQATLVDQAGMDGILIGDSIGMTTFGEKNTLNVKMSHMIKATKSVAKGAKNAFIIGDMPYMSYKSDYDAITNAGKFLSAGCDCVKVEGVYPERVKAISQSGILVQSHIGLVPQQRAKLGGYRVQGKTKKDYEVILDQALRLQEAGANLLLLEAVPNEVGGAIRDELQIPVYSIGGGNRTDGQLVILHDLIGLFFEFKSKFVKRYLEGGRLIQEALAAYASEVRTGKFPAEEHFYKIDDNELEKLLGDDKWKYERK